MILSSAGNDDRVQPPTETESEQITAVIFAGGLGTRLGELTHEIPKPLVEIGGYPIIWHIMKHLSHFGVRRFILPVGYKGLQIKRYFRDLALLAQTLTVDTSTGEVSSFGDSTENWEVTIVDTGVTTETGGRFARIEPIIRNEDLVLVTYGDGLIDLDIDELISFHRAGGRAATITCTQPPGRFGMVDLDGGVVEKFEEKPTGDGAWVNAGYFVGSPSVAKLVDGDSTAWETGVLSKLAEAGDLGAFQHRGFWQPMDTLREKNILEQMWQSGKAPWAVWN